MMLHVALMGVAAFGVLVGLFYRISAVLLLLCWTYLFLLDQAWYQNHYYLICLIMFLLAIA